MLNLYEGTTVLFGMAFLNTLVAFTDFGPGCKFFGHGSDDELGDLEVFLQEEYANGRKVQTIWAEFPSNPLLATPDLKRLRALADEYDIVLAIDDTIGSSLNVDILHMTDILVTSLTKSFSGYADVIAGSAVLNPSSRKYAELKPLFERLYIPELYVADAEALEKNSRDYLPRTIKLNNNAFALLQYAITKVYYPSRNPSSHNYKQFMRPPTQDFTPGYGCLFTLELADLQSTIVFYDTLNVHKGPHLGAPWTLP